MSLRETILKSNDIQTEPVKVEEWGVTVFIKGMTGAERDEYEASLFSIEGKGKNADVKMNRSNIRAKLLIKTIVDEQGNRIFGDGDVESLGGKSASALDKLFEVAQKLSGLTEADMEELEKNLNSGPDGTSATN